VWRDDIVRLKVPAAADASLRGGGSAPLCATFATFGDAQQWRVCNYGAASTPPTTLSARVAGAVLMLGGAMLSAAPAGFTGVAGQLLFPSTETVETPSASGKLLRPLARTLPFRSWFVAPPVGAAQATRLVGAADPSVVFVDLGVVQNVPTSMPVPIEQRCPLIISEYVAGEAVELFNPSPGPILLDDYAVLVSTNGLAAWAAASAIALTGSLAPGGTFVVSRTGSSLTAQLRSATLVLTGDDPVALRCMGTVVDVVGSPDDAALDQTLNLNLPHRANALSGTTLRRRPWVTTPNTGDWGKSAGDTALESEWLVVAPVAVDDLGRHTSQPLAPNRNCFVFFASYGESASRKFVELFNPTSRSANMSDYALLRLTNGGTFAADSTRYDLSGVLSARERVVLSGAAIGAPDIAADRLQVVIGGVSRINGNDALALLCNGVIVDTVGAEGTAPAVGFAVSGVADATSDHVLVRAPQTIFGVDWSVAATAGASAAGGWSVRDVNDLAVLKLPRASADTFNAPSCTLYDGVRMPTSSNCCRLAVHCSPLHQCTSGRCTGPTDPPTPAPTVRTTTTIFRPPPTPTLRTPVPTTVAPRTPAPPTTTRRPTPFPTPPPTPRPTPRPPTPAPTPRPTLPSSVRVTIVNGTTITYTIVDTDAPTPVPVPTVIGSEPPLETTQMQPLGTNASPALVSEPAAFPPEAIIGVAAGGGGLLCLICVVVLIVCVVRRRRNVGESDHAVEGNPMFYHFGVTDPNVAIVAGGASAAPVTLTQRQEELKRQHAERLAQQRQKPAPSAPQGTMQIPASAALSMRSARDDEYSFVSTPGTPSAFPGAIPMSVLSMRSARDDQQHGTDEFAFLPPLPTAPAGQGAWSTRSLPPPVPLPRDVGPSQRTGQMPASQAGFMSFASGRIDGPQSSNAPNACYVCGATFGDAAALNQHVMNDHTYAGATGSLARGPPPQAPRSAPPKKLQSSSSSAKFV